MTDPTQNSAGPDDPHGSDPAYDPYAPHTARDPYAAYDRPRSHDPYGSPQEPRPPRTGAYQPNGTPPQSSHGGVPQPPREGGDPATQVWQGTTHQEHGYGERPPQPPAPAGEATQVPRHARSRAPGGRPAGAERQAAYGAEHSVRAAAPAGRTGGPYAPGAPGAPGTLAPPDGGIDGPDRTGSPADSRTDRAAADDDALTPAQRARAEGASPIIAPGLRPALLTAALALLIALTAPVGRPLLVVPVILLQAVTAAGWFRLNGMWPARQGIALAFAGGLAADAALLATDRGDAPAVAVGTLGVWFLLVLALQLRNRGSADERLYALTAGLASSALVVVAAGLLAAAAYSAGAVAAGAAAVAVAAVVRALPLPSSLPAWLLPAAALPAAAGAGFAVGQLFGSGMSGALLGAVAGVCALVGLRVASYDYPSRFVHMTAGVALPLTVAAPAVYVLSRTFG